MENVSYELHSHSFTNSNHHIEESPWSIHRGEPPSYPSISLVRRKFHEPILWRTDFQTNASSTTRISATLSRVLTVTFRRHLHKLLFLPITLSANASNLLQWYSNLSVSWDFYRISMSKKYKKKYYVNLDKHIVTSNKISWRVCCNEHHTCGIKYM